MSKIEFVSHENFPDDEYTKELVYICLEGKYRIAYVRKASKSGGLFWCPVSVGIYKNGVKEYFPAFLQDSNFVERDIKAFLDARQWEKPSLEYKKVDYPRVSDKNISNPQGNQDESELPF